MQINITKNLTSFAIVIAGLVIAAAVVFTGIYLKSENSTASVARPEAEQPAEEPVVPQYDTPVLEKFAKCLAEKGMKFYGASRCSWCKKEKDIFGEAKDSLPYVECVDAKDQQKLTPECQTAGIQSFPTWQLANGVKEPGFKTIEQLETASGCKIGQ